MNDIKAIVADLEKLDRVATPAPWGAAQSLCCRDRGTVSVQETGHTQPSHAFSTWDADLVAAARNALPALLAELKRLWAMEQERKAPSPSTREIVVAKIQALTLAKTITNFVSVNRAAERKAAQATGQTCEWFVSESLEIANRIEKAIRDVENNNE